MVGSSIAMMFVSGEASAGGSTGGGIGHLGLYVGAGQLCFGNA